MFQLPSPARAGLAHPRAAAAAVAAEDMRVAVAMDVAAVVRVAAAPAARMALHRVV